MLFFRSARNRSRKHYLKAIDGSFPVLKKLAVALLLLLVLTQLALQIDGVRHWAVGVERAEGIRLN